LGAYYFSIGQQAISVAQRVLIASGLFQDLYSYILFLQFQKRSVLTNRLGNLKISAFILPDANRLKSLILGQ